MNSILTFGEHVSGYSIPVLNEREIRAAAGILFLMMSFSIQTVVIHGDFTLLKYSITMFLFDFILRVFVNPKFSPSLIIGRVIVRNQVPEYVGAQQKKFAWSIGVMFATTMFLLLIVVNAYSPITGIICFTCLIFLFFESSFGICLGCKFYPLFHKQKPQYCPGEVCDRTQREDIQRISFRQIGILFLFIVSMILLHYYFNDYYGRQPYQLF